jgi:hypothetical protein
MCVLHKTMLKEGKGGGSSLSGKGRNWVVDPKVCLVSSSAAPQHVRFAQKWFWGWMRGLFRNVGVRG